MNKDTIMSLHIVKAAIGTAALSLTLTPVWAQEAGHQMAGMPAGTGGGAAMCAQKSAGVTRAIDAINGQVEDARQTNDASKLRASIADLQSVFAQIKTQLADCVALTAGAGGGGMSNMPGMDHSKAPTAPGAAVTQPGSPTLASGTAMAGMDHSKMQMPPKPEAKAPVANAPTQAAKTPAAGAGMDHSKMQMPETPAPAKAAAPATGVDHSKMEMNKTAPAAAGTHGGHGDAAPVAAVVFTVRTDPAPPRSGKNDFEVTLKDAEGKPIADAAVSLAFYMPAMPSMKADAAQLTSAGNGVYKGSGTIGMAGDWDVTVTASRNGQQLDVKKMRLAVK